MTTIDRTVRGTTYRLPALQPPTSRHNIIENLALFLVANGEATNGRWSGPLLARDQRALFGVFLGKGQISIDGERDRVRHTITICFGTDFATTDELELQEDMRWRHVAGSTPAPVNPLDVIKAGFKPVNRLDPVAP